MARRRPRTDRRRKQLEKERARRAAGHMRLGGRIENRECRLDLVVRTPPGVAPRRRAITAIVDTGCTATALRPDIAEELGLPVIDRAKVATASSGTSCVACDVVLARLELNSGGKSVASDRRLVVAEMANEMLFGMDALAGGVLEVDLVKGRWTWTLHKVRDGAP